MKKKPQPETDQPQVDLNCPHCGGNSSWNLLQTLNQCNFCGSVLYWPYPEGEPDYLVADSVIQKESDLIDVLAMYDAMGEASRRRGMLRPGRSEYDPDIYFDLGSGFSDTDVYAIKRERIHKFRLLKSFCVYVPYELICSLLSFHTLGRIGGDQKVFQTLFFDSETIQPGYSSEWNFRDTGLQLSKQHLRPLATGKWKESFIAPDLTARATKSSPRLINQRKLLEVEIKPIWFESKTVESHRWWVYRPYYFLNAQTPSGSGWFMVDGQFGTIAGTPSAMEVTKVSRGGWKKLDLHSIRAVDVQVIPFRCPHCGKDVKLKKALFQLCDNCTRVLEVKDGGLKVVPYHLMHAEQMSWWPKVHRGSKVWLPFWRVKTSILFEGKHYDDFVEIVGSLIPSVRQNIQQKNFYVPALDCWQIAKYDRWIFQFAASLSESIESGSESVLHEQMSAKDFVFPPAVAPKTISSLFPHIAAGFTSNVIQTRLSTLLVNKLGNARFHIKDLDLVFVPAPLLELRGNDPRIQGPRETIEWLPLKDADWPPVLRRTVRRWKSMSTDQPNVMAPKSRLKWLTSPFNR